MICLLPLNTALGLSLGHITPDTFPLPTVRAELRRLSGELHNGHGFFVLRGLRVDEHTREENVIAYVGISAHIAPLRGRQDAKFDGRPADVVLTHIKDLTATAQKEAIGSPAYTTDKQVFHTDSGDIVSLFALETAAEGGASKLASTWKVYNEIARSRPDLIHTLSQDWDVEVYVFSSAPPPVCLKLPRRWHLLMTNYRATYLPTSFRKSEKGYTSRPLLHFQPATANSPERVSLHYGRRYFVGFGALPRSHNIPPITEAQAEALDTLHFLGEKFCVSTDFQKGDIQYVNNLALFHSRDGFRNEGDKQ